MIRTVSKVFIAALCVGLLAPNSASACPFCDAVGATLREEIVAADVAVTCKLVHRPAADAVAAECTFEVLEVLKGEPTLTATAGATKPYQLKIVYFGEEPLGATFFTFAVGAPQLLWAMPTPLTERGQSYVSRLATLPQAPAKRLPFFADYFEDSDPWVADDAYHEYARASYADLLPLKDRLPRDKLLAWIADRNVTTAHRRQYLCLLSICGRPEDVPPLEAEILRDDEPARPALDAVIGCYLVLRGEAGMPLIEERFLKNAKADYADTYGAITALRFLIQDSKAVPRERILRGFQCLLDRPRYADLIIPDFTRAEDWSAVPKLVALFKSANEKDETAWCRVAIANYLRVCPLPEAKTALAELEKLDPKAVHQAQFFFGGADVPPPGSVRPAAE